MEKLKKLLKTKYTLEIAISFVMFVIAIYFHNFIEIIIYILYFLIFLELTRTVITFITEHRVIVRYLVDAAIIFILREFIINVVKINIQEFENWDQMFNNHVVINVMLLSYVLLFMFLLRFLANKTMMKGMPKL